MTLSEKPRKPNRVRSRRSPPNQTKLNTCNLPVDPPIIQLNQDFAVKIIHQLDSCRLRSGVYTGHSGGARAAVYTSSGFVDENVEYSGVIEDAMLDRARLSSQAILFHWQRNLEGVVTFSLHLGHFSFLLFYFMVLLLLEINKQFISFDNIAPGCSTALCHWCLVTGCQWSHSTNQ